MFTRYDLLPEYVTFFTTDNGEGGGAGGGSDAGGGDEGAQPDAPTSLDGLDTQEIAALDDEVFDKLFVSDDAGDGDTPPDPNAVEYADEAALEAARKDADATKRPSDEYYAAERKRLGLPDQAAQAPQYREAGKRTADQLFEDFTKYMQLPEAERGDFIATANEWKLVNDEDDRQKVAEAEAKARQEKLDKLFPNGVTSIFDKVVELSGITDETKKQLLKREIQDLVDTGDGSLRKQATEALVRPVINDIGRSLWQILGGSDEAAKIIRSVPRERWPEVAFEAGKLAGGGFDQDKFVSETLTLDWLKESKPDLVTALQREWEAEHPERKANAVGAESGVKGVADLSKMTADEIAAMDDDEFEKAQLALGKS